ncbi:MULTISPECIES: TIGR03086 family metal-binding protein [Actinomycetes]|uniref:TIGR03086 family metal-binding protein n=1 Tax=Actinomycetes TaxID=1760 RepID=UPI0035CB182B
MPTPDAPPLDLDAPAIDLARLVLGVTEEHLSLPTPCRYPVSVLLVHLIGLSRAFTDAARKLDGPLTRSAPSSADVELAAGWREELPLRLAGLVGGWRDPAAWTGMTVAGGVELPGTVMGVVANNELVLHGWDLAVATGQQIRVAEANVAASWQMVSETPDDPAARRGLFGPVVPVEDQAPLLHRTLGAAGRDPGWVAGAR